jgi:DNA-binding SARP family transcriptional activator
VIQTPVLALLGEAALTGSGSALRFNILGSPEIWSNGVRLRLSGVIRERVLAILLLDYGKVLPVSRLVAAVWAEDPPGTASHQVRKAVSDLRRLIPDGEKILITDGHGYRAVVTDAQLDLAEFRSLLRQAQSAAETGNRGDAATALRSALGLWRGPILSGEGGVVIEAAAVAITERRLAAFEQLAELRLGAGESADLVGELREYIGQFPLRETLRVQLITALWRSGRQAEALEEYARVRALLEEELGTDPGPELVSTYEAMLRQSPELLSSGPAAPAVLTAEPAISPALLTIESPRSLPYDLPDFTGRHQEVDEILAHAPRASDDITRVVAIDGMGGCGKTALAVHSAHLLSSEFPDAQIYVNLHGYTPDKQPVTVGAALQEALRLLGVPGDRIPDDVAGRAAVWQSALTGKRVLLLADNAADSAAVRQLIPSSTGSLVLVTSRSRLIELDGAAWISIGPMSPEESTNLMRVALGEQRLTSEPEAAAELVRLCGHLPLALRIAGARLRNRPAWTVRYLAGRLRDETRWLDELSSGGRSVAGTIALSYESLDNQCRAGFEILAMHPGDTMDVYSAAALLGTSVTEAEDVLEILLDAHLLQQPEIGLYAFHDLVRGVAHKLRREPVPEAIERLLDYYVTVTGAACNVLFPGRSNLATGIREHAAGIPEIRDARHAKAWFAREHKGLLSVVAMARRHEHDRHAVFLARDAGFYLDVSGYMEEFRQVCEVAVDSGRRLDSPGLLGLMLVNLSIACWKLGETAQGIEAAREALGISTGTGDQKIEAASNRTLGRFKTLLGEFPEAVAHIERAICLERMRGTLRAPTLTALSAVYEGWGRYREAVQAASDACEVANQLGRSWNEWVALTDLASAHAGLCEYTDAERCLARARQLCDDTREEPGLVAEMLALSADVSHRLAKETEAADYAERALSLISLTSSPARRVKALNTIGRLQARKGEYVSALDMHTHARELAGKMGYRPEEARALSGMSAAATALGDEQAAASWQSAAVELFTKMGIGMGESSEGSRPGLDHTLAGS